MSYACVFLQLLIVYIILVFLVLAIMQYRRIYARAKLQAGNLIHLWPNITVSRQYVSILGRCQHLDQQHFYFLKQKTLQMHVERPFCFYSECANYVSRSKTLLQEREKPVYKGLEVACHQNYEIFTYVHCIVSKFEFDSVLVLYGDLFDTVVFVKKP